MRMKGAVEDRAVELGEYILENQTTVRAAAKQFHISKSTVHKDITQILRHVDPVLCEEVKDILEYNKQERHLRGGEATRQKYYKMTHSS